MAKGIKFNLILDDKPIRNIEELRDYFNVQDILEIYKNGLLARWLDVREYTDYFERVQEIQENDDLKLVKKLIAVFDIETNDEEIKKSIYAIEFLKKKEEKLISFHNKIENWKEIIGAYHEDYEKLKNTLFERKSDMPYLKESIKEIYDSYFSLFMLNYQDLYKQLVDGKYIFPILAILMNENLRRLFLEHKTIKPDLFKKVFRYIGFKSDCYYYGAEIKEFTSELKESNEIVVLDEREKNFFGISKEWKYKKKKLYVSLDQLIAEPLAIKENIKLFSGETEGYWKDIEPAGKKYMILFIKEGNYVRNAGKAKEELGVKEVNGEFLILDGLDYKSNDQDHNLIYVEV